MIGICFISKKRKGCNKMDFLISLYNFFDARMDTPTNYDSYHLLCVGIMLAITVLLICLFKKAGEKTVRGLAGFFWVTMVVLEIIKQLLFGLSIVDGKFVWNYAWYAFPFQFCSSPLYVLPIVAFAKNGKFRDAAIIFLATFGFFAGACVYVFPNDVFTPQIFINIQTMIHHGTQVFFGTYLAFRYKHLLNFKNLVRATGVFTVLSALAMLMNIGTHYLFPAFGIDETFNMFYISPYHECTLPLLSEVYKAVPYPAFLCIYIFGFMLCAGLVMLIMKGLIKITGMSKITVDCE